MFNRQKTPTSLELAIEEAFRDMRDLPADDDDYTSIVDNIVRLYPLKEIDRPQRVSADTWAIVGANLIGILAILKHEEVNVIATKALGLITKLR